MESKTFIFDTDDGRLQIEVPVKDGIVLSNKFCPKELLEQTDLQFYPINGEPEEAFIKDCRRLLEGMKLASEVNDRLERHIAGLMAVVMEHILTTGQLVFETLLIYMDCFSHLLKAARMPSLEIYDLYPRMVRKIIDLFPDKVFYNCIKLEKFEDSRYDKALDNLLAV